MATKAAKPAAKGAETVVASAPASASKKPLWIIAGLFLLLLIGGGTTLFMMMNKANNGADHMSQAPVFVVIEPFVVNLQPESGDHYLQVAMTLQVPSTATADTLKAFMPQVRSRLLMVMSSKKASELITSEGKRDLVDEIIEQLGEPFVGNSKGPTITDVFFTSFVIQQQ